VQQENESSSELFAFHHTKQHHQQQLCMGTKWHHPRYIFPVAGLCIKVIDFCSRNLIMSEVSCGFPLFLQVNTIEKDQECAISPDS
jgi:hypothetical protein